MWKNVLLHVKDSIIRRLYDSIANSFQAKQGLHMCHLRSISSKWFVYWRRFMYSLDLTNLVLYYWSFCFTLVKSELEAKKDRGNKDLFSSEWIGHWYMRPTVNKILEPALSYNNVKTWRKFEHHNNNGSSNTKSFSIWKWFCNLQIESQ